MTVEAFLEALKGLTAVPQSILEHLEALAPYMTDAERKSALAKFKKLNKEAEQEGKKIDEIVSKEGKNMELFQKKVVPQIRKAREDEEQEQTLGDAEDQLNKNL